MPQKPTFRERKIINYENRLRAFSTPDKVGIRSRNHVTRGNMGGIVKKLQLGFTRAHVKRKGQTEGSR